MTLHRNLDDGTHILHPARFAQLDQSSSTKTFIPAHENFRVIAIAAPVPPYPGHPLDPPFRSRFQARFIDSIGASLALDSGNGDSNPFIEKFTEIILSTQLASEARNDLSSLSGSSLPAFPQTAVTKLHRLAAMFPPAGKLAPEQLARVVLSLHPALLSAPFRGWASLSQQFEREGLGRLESPSSEDDSGLLGYRLTSIERTGDVTARCAFAHTSDGTFSRIDIDVPSGPKPFVSPSTLKVGETILLSNGVKATISKRLLSSLTCLLQAHALGWDISLIPPVQASTASSSTSIVVRLFGDLLGYEIEDLHLYKELGGRELVMRRHIEDGGATTWKPRYVFFSVMDYRADYVCSPLIQGAWDGRLVHLSGTDTIGATAGSLSRLTQDREIELWEGKRIVAEVKSQEVFTLTP